jgi:hypothetical protein
MPRLRPPRAFQRSDPSGCLAADMAKNAALNVVSRPSHRSTGARSRSATPSEFADDKPSLGLEHAGDFRHRVLSVLNKVEDGYRHHNIESCIIEGQALKVQRTWQRHSKTRDQQVVRNVRRR